MATKNTSAADSVASELAATAESNAVALALPAAPDPIPAVLTSVPAFPRDVVLVNDTAISYVVARTFVGSGSREYVCANSNDDIKRMVTDCRQIMELGGYASAEVAPLRVIESE